MANKPFPNPTNVYEALQNFVVYDLSEKGIDINSLRELSDWMAKREQMCRYVKEHNVDLWYDMLQAIYGSKEP